MKFPEIYQLAIFLLALLCAWIFLIWINGRRRRRANQKKEREDREALAWARIQYPEAKSIKMNDKGVICVDLSSSGPTRSLAGFIRAQDRSDAARDLARDERRAAERRRRAQPAVAPHARRDEPEAAPSPIPVPWEDAAWVGAWKKQDPEPAPAPEPYFLSGEGGSYGGGGASGVWDSSPSPSPSPAPSDPPSSSPSPSE